MSSFLDFLSCGCSRRKEPITSEFDSRFGASNITAPNDGAYSNPNPSRPRAPWEYDNLPKVAAGLEKVPTSRSRASSTTHNREALKSAKVPSQPASPKSAHTHMTDTDAPTTTSSQPSPVFSSSASTAATTPGTDIGMTTVTIPVHSAYISGYSSSPPDSGKRDSTSPTVSYSGNSMFKSLPSAASSTATTPLNPQHPSPPGASPPLRSKGAADGKRASMTSSYGGNRHIPNFVMTTSQNSPPFAEKEAGRVVDRGRPNVLIGDVPKRGKGDFKGSPDSEMSVEQWPGTM